MLLKLPTTTIQIDDDLSHLAAYRWRINSRGVVVRTYREDGHVRTKTLAVEIFGKPKEGYVWRQKVVGGDYRTSNFDLVKRGGWSKRPGRDEEV